MKKIILTALFGLLTAPAFAFGAVEVDKNGFDTTTFWCSNKTYFTDVPLENFHGCDVDTVSMNGLPANIVVAYHGWQTLEDESKTPNRTVFVELPQGQIYRLKSTYFLTSPLLQHYFNEQTGNTAEVSNILLSNYSTRNLQLYGNTFCVQHYLKRPFQGTIGWCQGDQVVGGNLGYVKGALPYMEAAILAQRYIYDMSVPVQNQKLFGYETRVGLNTDAQGYYYWAFAVPAAQPNKVLGTFILRVYMDGHIVVKEFAGVPPLHEM